MQCISALTCQSVICGEQLHLQALCCKGLWLGYAWPGHVRLWVEVDPPEDTSPSLPSLYAVCSQTSRWRWSLAHLGRQWCRPVCGWRSPSAQLLYGLSCVSGSSEWCLNSMRVMTGRRNPVPSSTHNILHTAQSFLHQPCRNRYHVTAWSLVYKLPKTPSHWCNIL